MTEKERAQQIVNDLTTTINKMGDKQMVISQSSAFKPTRASKSRLIKRRDELIKKYKL